MLSIKVIKDIPEIGRNLQDHPAVTVMNDISKPIAITDKIFQKGTGKVSTKHLKLL
jgi:hypothetical protein